MRTLPADGGRIHILDVSDSLAPAEIGRFTSASEIYQSVQLDVERDRVFVTSAVREAEFGRLLAFDISQPEWPGHLGAGVTNGIRYGAEVHDMQLHEGLLYVAAGAEDF